MMGRVLSREKFVHAGCGGGEDKRDLAFFLESLDINISF
jgi:hypothetical protein